MSKTFEEWVEFYNKKAPEKFERNNRFELFYSPEKGFCEISASDKMLMIWQVSGDGRFWKKFAEDLAREIGLKTCGTICERKEFKAYIRLGGFKIKRIETKNGLKKYYGCDELGNQGVMTEFICVDGRHLHFAMWEVKSGGF